jgi:hypothetical protein
MSADIVAFGKLRRRAISPDLDALIDAEHEALMDFREVEDQNDGPVRDAAADRWYASVERVCVFQPRTVADLLAKLRLALRALDGCDHYQETMRWLVADLERLAIAAADAEWPVKGSAP